MGGKIRNWRQSLQCLLICCDIRTIALSSSNEVVPTASRVAHPYGPAGQEMECVTSYVSVWLGRLDTAERFAANSISHWTANAAYREAGARQLPGAYK